jgi:hypothetical protein
VWGSDQHQTGVPTTPDFDNKDEGFGAQLRNSRDG